MTYLEKLAAIRSQMRSSAVDAYLIHSADPHMSEYLPAHYKCLEFACGFTGSAGVLVITQDFAGLWTDSRYFNQAEEQLKDTGYELVKLKIPHTPEYIQWLPKYAQIACNFKLLSVTLSALFKANHMQVSHADFLDPIWENRPELPSAPAFLLAEKYSGKPLVKKLEEVREVLSKTGATAHLISSLDDIAWLFNIRGTDVKCNPVVLSFCLILQDQVLLFIDKGKFTAADILEFSNAGVTLSAYGTVEAHLARLNLRETLLIDPKRTCTYLYNLVPEEVQVQLGINPSTHLKSVKNTTEISNFKQAMIRDGVAMTRFVKWLKENVEQEIITELSASEKLKGFRAEQDSFAGVSFDSIAGYKAHAALPHYMPTTVTDVQLKAEGMFLIDSGGQYYLGTTDITRMVILGPVTAEEKTDYTLVLKGLIEGSSAQFPTGTCGYQLDGIIRKPLWDHARNYGHGTGHGVGYFLNVHEGPQSISPDNLPIPFLPGMVTSIEPGIYRPGKHGVRIENLVLTVAAAQSDFGSFLSSETITIAMIDTEAIDITLLEQRHINWLNNYHEFVIRELKPHLTTEELSWLIRNTFLRSL
ncbi:aminopeptidase P family protein [Pedobacter sp. MR2016-24]|uniref:aminopeptidase P family protein n=1 Tax=Pedobacter sp. MR2016-24 TaxID=2994466 RepID=UPI002246B87E|nr:aminopeptidase P family protein [Pedobacter sp. MR2016-24]MCX2486371.1 aminopeptidase family protein P [Pedobacter sp. MR2016-24]